MRGKGHNGSVAHLVLGITPAHAGKSPELVATTPLVKDHPRACGEKRSDMYLTSARLGSPPRMRGKDGGDK